MTPLVRRSPHLLLIPLAAFLAVLPLLLHGPSCGHDFTFHLLNWLEANTQLTHAHYPRWAFNPAWNAGEPRFLFYPPLSWLLGALLTALLPFHLVPAAFTWICLTLSGFALHRLAAPYASTSAATLAAVLYLLNPYMLFTAYERTAYAELLAAAFLPLLFGAVLAPRPRIPSLAIPLALLWLSNVPAAIAGTYALALLALLRLALETRPERLRLALNTLSGSALGVLLPAFYIVPAAWQRRFIQPDMLNVEGMRPSDNTLFHHTPDVPHDVVLHTVSTIACLVLTLTALALLSAFLRTRNSTGISQNPQTQDPEPNQTRLSFPTLLPLALLTLLIAFLLTPASLPLWNHLPELRLLQFPWRLLALLTSILCLAAALALRNLPPRGLLLSVALPALLIPFSWTQFVQPCEPLHSPDSFAALYHSPPGTEPTDEYTPVEADGDAIHPHSPPYWLAPVTSAPPPARSPEGPAPNHLTLDLPIPEYLILNRRQYPAWHITRNGQPIAPAVPEREDGLLALALPAGHSAIDLTLVHSPDETAGLALSALAALTLFFLRRRSFSSTQTHSLSSPAMH